MNPSTVTKVATRMEVLGRTISMHRFVLLVTLIFVDSSLQEGKEATDLTNGDSPSIGTQKTIKTPFSLEEIYKRHFYNVGFNASWISDSEMLYTDEETENYLVLNLETMKSEFLVEGGLLSNYKQSLMTLSPNRSHLLIGYDPVSQFRHSALRKYVLYDIQNQTYQTVADGADLALVRWLPKDKGFVYVLHNDVYHARINKKEIQVRKLTDDGVTGIVYNGVPDWVYEEEVLASGTAMWFSPEGDHLVFATYNDTGVKDVTYFYYGEPGSLRYQYPTPVKIKWPKAGTPNPKVTLHSIDLSNPDSSLINLKAPTDIVGEDHILYTVAWLDNERVTATWTNRVQNRGQMVVYETTGRENKLLYLYEKDGWLEVPVPIYHNGYLILLKAQESGTAAGRAKHVTRYTYEDNQLSQERDLTPGTIEVHNVFGVSKLNDRIYFLGNKFEESSRRHLYSISIHGDEEPRCISCNVITPEGNNCTYASASFSRDMSHYALLCSGPDPAVVKIYNRWDKELLNWELNEDLRKKLVKKLRPRVKHLIVPSNGFESHVRLLLPPDFDEKKSYPMVVQVYAGPNTLRITDELSFNLDLYMATNRSIIYAWIDGRGSAHRGSKLLHQIYRKMGVVEIEDQITVTQALQAAYPWIDAKRTGIWGWSYGGFSTAMVLATDVKKVFKCGISVAPVSSWIYYDSIYTERYMGLPTEEDNLHGYNTSDVTRRVNGMRGKKFMLIHGTGDDNVHYQQGMALAKALEHADIPFEQVTYPDEAHALSGVSPHFYHTMDRFWSECFGLPRNYKR